MLIRSRKLTSYSVSTLSKCKRTGSPALAKVLCNVLRSILTALYRRLDKVQTSLNANDRHSTAKRQLISLGATSTGGALSTAMFRSSTPSGDYAWTARLNDGSHQAIGAIIAWMVYVQTIAAATTISPDSELTKATGLDSCRTRHGWFQRQGQ
jgi:hypothetical protein